jgi:alpha-tubulin suppressor-like RCC1 family protein
LKNIAIYTRWATALLLIACGGASTPAKEATGANDGTNKSAAPANGSRSNNANDLVQIECGDFHSCALFGDGKVKCWGRNNRGALGNVGSADQVKPILVPGVAPLKQVGLGSTFSCGLTLDGRVQCWGSGRIFGDGKNVVNAPPTFVGDLKGVTELAVSGVLICARSENGAVKCWGTEKDIAYSKSADEIAVASAHICTRTGQEIRCTGEDSLGKLGAVKSAKPVKQLVTGDAFACSLDEGGSAACWGQNTSGQLGNTADTNAHDKPMPVTGLPPIARLAAGESQACAILADGTARCWGNNSDGELGIGRTSDSERPAPVKLNGRATELCMASMHACAHTDDGKVYCWGDNRGGQLGDGTEEARTVPTEVKF